MRLIALLLVTLFSAIQGWTQPAEPLRVFLRCGAKTHGPAENGLHDHPRFLGEFTRILGERGVRVDGGMKFPTQAQLEATDVLVMFAADAGTIEGENRAHLESFLKRGGGIVCVHDAVCGNDPQWFKTIIGGAWEHGHSKWYENPISFYYVNQEHPITQGASNFDIDDEIYWDLHMMPTARILAASWIPDRRNTKDGRAHPHIYETAPQMWTYENTLAGGKPYRSFVSILGHKFGTFEQPHHRAVLLRGIAWAGQRPVDSLCKAEELATLRYPEGGPTAPDKAAAKLELHPEFKMDVIAAEPLVNKPMSMDWDAEGRLWVAESVEYPNGRRGLKPAFEGKEWKDQGGLVDQAGMQNRAAHDRISILTDSNGDGKMDAKKVWYEGLELVTGFVFHRDGVIAAAAPDIFWIRDTDHDGKAETVTRLYTGLGTSDTHAVINNLRWGMDGWVYATHGYSAGEVKSPDGSKSFGRIGSGVVRFKPDGSQFEQYSSKGGNTWGLDFGWDGDLFYTQPTSGDLLMHVILPESVLSKSPGIKSTSYQVVIKSPPSHPLMKWEQMAYVQIDWVGGFTAAAGAAIYSGGTWPERYQGNYFTTEPTINIVHHEEIFPSSAGYGGRKLRTEEFIGSRDLWFRPIETRIGPDGALYVLDFYNQAVIHNDTRGPQHNNVNAAVRPDRDHYFGRIWKIDHKEAKPLTGAKSLKGDTSLALAALESPNRHVRMNAQRILVEQGDASIIGKLIETVEKGSPAARIHALWAAEQMGKLPEGVLIAALNTDQTQVRKAASRIAAQHTSPSGSIQQALLKNLQDSSSAVRVQSLVALSGMELGDDAVKQIVERYPDFKDAWVESAALVALSTQPVRALEAVLVSKDAGSVKALVSSLSAQAAAKPETAAALVNTLARAKGSPEIKLGALETLSRSWKTSSSAPAWNAELKQSLQTLMQSDSVALQMAALPLVAKWDVQGNLKSEVLNVMKQLQARLKDTSADETLRAQSATALVGVRSYDTEIIPSVAALLGSQESATLQEKLLRTLGESGDPRVGTELVKAFPKLSPTLQDLGLNSLMKRADWTGSLLDGLKSGTLTLANLGPANIHRLRYHPDAAMAKRAQALIEELRGPQGKEKQELIARLSVEVVKPGDAAKGKQLFTQNCANCHRLGKEGKEVGPALTGMGAHGPAELLVHIIDPNREVDPSFTAWNFETQDGESYDGIVARENRGGVTLRNAAGEMDLKRAQIKTQRNTGRSLMPEGFESLGGEGLRDLLTYMTQDSARFRVLDLKPAYTSDSSKGMFYNVDTKWERLALTKFGIVQVQGIPFEILANSKSPGGRNVIMLKGGEGYAKSYPQKVVIPAAGIKANRLHFLGGVAGWGFPCCGENQDMPAAKITVQFADGSKEEILTKNGVEFADYNGQAEVPGSKPTRDLVEYGQLRWFTKVLSRTGDLREITLESFNNVVAPAFVAITAELAEPGAPLPGTQTASAASTGVASDAVPSPFKWDDGIRILLVGGGSSHDFNRWFNLADVATLKAAGGISPQYTERYREVIPALNEIQVLGWSANSPQKDPVLRKALLDYVDSGKGLLLLHPGNWYLWSDWPEWNRLLVGGGSRGHDKYQEFEVTVTEPSHPLMKGVPTTFRITDELYHHEVDPQGTPMKVLATGRNLATGKTYPVVWIVQHPKSRIASITLGHDGQSHDLPAYKTLLNNAVRWAAGKAE